MTGKMTMTLTLTAIRSELARMSAKPQVVALRSVWVGTKSGRAVERNVPNSSREAAACESPARQCRVRVGKNPSPGGTAQVLTHTRWAQHRIQP